MLENIRTSSPGGVSFMPSSLPDQIPQPSRKILCDCPSMAYHERFHLDLHIISPRRKATVMIRLEYIANACGFHFEDSKLGCTTSKQSSAI
ncbi:hypothetical protein sscle_07g062020 [Sclerotinia sclerotiorum 1980 UF-70]|uniref:Uncharacterized protein n=1 Tax=Sclerotinia sclerotiorum (strain ATCC 18683 / 1980 / Ss-1) TaxID=665079 RepID=A0A1D9Q9E9_SCLS1|nr:hypothetical protein sscle_07g062020 [Sclerotinia sclerotiorum 1980 UF-70]